MEEKKHGPQKIFCGRAFLMQSVFQPFFYRSFVSFKRSSAKKIRLRAIPTTQASTMPVSWILPILMAIPDRPVTKITEVSAWFLDFP